MCEAFYNVFDNAVKYSKSNSTIDITMKQTEMFYKIQIRDYGIGIKDGEENKIFQRFYRGEQTRGQEGCWNWFISFQRDCFITKRDDKSKTNESRDAYRGESSDIDNSYAPCKKFVRCTM